MSSQWTVRLSWPAQVDLERMPWDDERELGGCLMGQVDRERRVLRVDRALSNPSGLGERTYTWIEGNHFVELERFDRGLKYPLPGSKPSEKEFRILGTVHSHPSLDEIRASDSDFESWRKGAFGFGHPFLGLIAAPGSQLWLAGFPDGFSWEDMRLKAWLTDSDGEVYAPRVTHEEQWLWALEDRVGLHDEAGR